MKHIYMNLFGHYCYYLQPSNSTNYITELVMASDVVIVDGITVKNRFMNDLNTKSFKDFQKAISTNTLLKTIPRLSSLGQAHTILNDLRIEQERIINLVKDKGILVNAEN